MKTETAPNAGKAQPTGSRNTETELKQVVTDIAELAIPKAAKLMPQGIEQQQLLKQRSQLLAKEEQSENLAEQEQYLRCRLGASEWYGIPYCWLDELIYATGLIAVPGTPSFVAGVINYQGELLTVLDLKHFFPVETFSEEEKEERRVAVVQNKQLRVGLLIDAVSGNEIYDRTSLSPALSSDRATNLNYVLGIYKGTVTMLDLDALLSDEELMVNDRPSQG
ncbi:chemotaxis protein CheW [Motiliproteus sp. MSK22-1]|uniref:chemotaxis protein CheW n=1 Tax=Motiliproteus sp. MSK22-1 TaxID=1897630 RepID=UPI0009769483|nr:chemotaxis protein CheW [Motiliproteus sp. MSK22-1]OMH32676.1 hypothetical protein BGP75_14125 [Motiliproteus sp. MSK22-1]